MDESTCIIDMARYFVGFAQSESCGNCTPCRIGTRVLLSTLEKIARGEGELSDLEVMQRASNTMVKTSLCGLGQAASNPVTSSLRYFRSEYEEHILSKTCPAAVCPDLFELFRSPRKNAVDAACACRYARWEPSRGCAGKRTIWMSIDAPSAAPAWRSAPGGRSRAFRHRLTGWISSTARRRYEH